MTNTLALLFLLCMGHIQPLAQNNSAQTAYHQRYAKTPSDSLKNWVFIKFKYGYPEQPPSEKENRSPANNNDEWIKWGVYINGFLAFATLILAIFAIVQAKAAKVAANAASRNAQILAETERPWVLEQIDHNTFYERRVNTTGDVPVIIAFQNYGRTPAWVIKIAVEYKERGIDSLNEEPDFEKSSKDPDLGEISMAPHPESHSQRIVFISRSDLYEAGFRRKFFFIYGKVHYRDGQGNIHDTGFCYRLHIENPNDPRMTGIYPYPAGKKYIYCT